MSTFDTPQFDPVFVAAVSALNAHCGGGATVGSGYRDIKSEWNSNGRVFMRQVDPLPSSILAVVPTGLVPFGN